MLFLYFMLAYAQIDELGYLYSVGRNRFITVKQDTHGTVFIMGAHKSERPSAIKISKETDKGRGGLIIYANDKDTAKYGLTNKVADLDYHNGHLYFYPKHMKWNQLARFVLQPGNQIKIMFGDHSCLFMAEDYKLKGESCRNDGDDKFQLFTWYPQRHFSTSRLRSILRNGPSDPDYYTSNGHNTRPSESPLDESNRRPFFKSSDSRSAFSDSEFSSDSGYGNDRTGCDNNPLLLLGMGSFDDRDKKKSKRYDSFKPSASDSKHRKITNDDSSSNDKYYKSSRKMHSKKVAHYNSMFDDSGYAYPKKCNRHNRGISAPSTSNLSLRHANNSICSIQKILFQPFNGDICNTVESYNNIRKIKKYAYKNTDSDSSESDCDNDVDRIWDSIQDIKVSSGISV